jgi:hypothetical protein
MAQLLLKHYPMQEGVELGDKMHSKQSGPQQHLHDYRKVEWWWWSNARYSISRLLRSCKTCSFLRRKATTTTKMAGTARRPTFTKKSSSMLTTLFQIISQKPLKWTQYCSRQTVTLLSAWSNSTDGNKLEITSLKPPKEGELQSRQKLIIGLRNCILEKEW